MNNKKKANWIYYFLTATIIWFVILQFTKKEITIPDTPIHENNDLQIKAQVKRQDLPPQVSLLKPDIETTSQPEPQENTNIEAMGAIETMEMTASHYLSQDFFDGNICTSEGIRAYYKPALEAAIKQLDNQYHHYHYNISNYLELNLYTTNITNHFKNQLISRLKFLHQYYISLLGDSVRHPITLNLVINPTREDYDYYASLNQHDTTATSGVYFGGINIAYIDYQASEEKALRTALHESIHALNAHIIGKAPHMFSEGMAEYFEDLVIINGKANIVISKTTPIKDPLSVTTFFDHEQWSYLEAHRLYSSSWAWFRFMISSPEGKQALIHFMKEEQRQPCNYFSRDDAYALFQEHYDTFESDFTDWLENGE